MGKKQAAKNAHADHLAAAKQKVLSVTDVAILTPAKERLLGVLEDVASLCAECGYPDEAERTRQFRERLKQLDLSSAEFRDELKRAEGYIGRRFTDIPLRRPPREPGELGVHLGPLVRKLVWSFDKAAAAFRAPEN